MSPSVTLDVEGRRLTLSRPDKVLYPATGFTKRQVIDYYRQIGPTILPHLRGRPVSLKRYPNGVDGQFFWNKECPRHRPAWVRTAAIWSVVNQRDVNYCLLDDLPALLWAANLAALELHVSLALAADPYRPTALVFDLDPGPPATIVECARVALWLREVFERERLVSFPKTSGSKGLQLFLPLNTPASFEQTKVYAHALAERLAAEHPDLVTANIRKEARPGRVFIDWSQNDDHKTMICVYSLRARQRPTVSMPIDWDEVEGLAHGADPASLVFLADQALERVERRGDLFAPVLRLEQRLPGA